MGTTTFSGPVKAGNILNTTGTTAGTDMANVGFAVMAQSASISETGDGATTGIVIPAKSQIVGIFIYPTVLFEGNVTLGSTVNGTDLSAALTTPADNSRSVFAPATNEVWHDIGDTDFEVFHDSTNAGAGNGRAVITVEYVQASNLL